MSNIANLVPKLRNPLNTDLYRVSSPPPSSGQPPTVDRHRHFISLSYQPQSFINTSLIPHFPSPLGSI
ncbi:Uncharacterized protein HZ326_22329 [Fusarium oxysporum f. sp. albedinis]|nr:Uncharacterized protein HZ326_22329 [Fusarium oxysporum f. sp. albedinis]